MFPSDMARCICAGEERAKKEVADSANAPQTYRFLHPAENSTGGMSVGRL